MLTSQIILEHVDYPVILARWGAYEEILQCGQLSLGHKIVVALLFKIVVALLFKIVVALLFLR
jgi:hypothetical protein